MYARQSSRGERVRSFRRHPSELWALASDACAGMLWRRGTRFCVATAHPSPAHPTVSTPTESGVHEGVVSRRGPLTRWRRARHERRGWGPTSSERSMGHDLGAGLGAQPTRTTEVIGVTMGDDHGMHPFERKSPRFNRSVSAAYRVLARQAGVDHGHAALVFQEIAIHVPETGHVHRQLAAQPPGASSVMSSAGGSCSWRRGRAAGSVMTDYGTGSFPNSATRARRRST